MVEYILLIIFYNIFKEEVIMTKKKFLAALSTAAITTSLLATTAFAATPAIEWNNNGGTATGEGGGEVRVPVIEVEVPLELPFAVNPYKLNLAEEGQTAITDQIYSDNYMIINHSEVPVAVATASKATATNVLLETTVTIDADSTKYIGSDATKKNAFLGMQFGKTIAFSNDAYTVTYDALTFDASNVKDEATLQAKGGLLLSSADEEVTFVLDVESDTNTAAGKNAAAFKYVGVLNDSCTDAYTDDDLKVTTVYTLSVLASDDIDATGANDPKGYEAAAAGDNAQSAQNVWKKK